MSDPQIYRDIAALYKRVQALETLESPASNAGSWTPSISGTGGGGTLAYTANRVGAYTRVSDLCYIQFRVELATVTTPPTGNLVVAGLPFTPRNRANGFWLIDITASDNLNIGATGVQVAGRVILNQNYLDIVELRDAAGFVSIAGSTAVAGLSIIGSGWYEVAV